MPPKKAPGKSDPDPQQGAEAAPPPPDPNVLLYLQASSRAFPRVAQLLQQQQQDLAAKAKEADDAKARSEQHARKEVTSFAVQRVALEAEVEELVARRKDLNQTIADAARQFEEEYKDRGVRNGMLLNALHQEQSRLEADSAQAENWSFKAASQTRVLQELDDQIQHRAETHAAEIEKMNTDHEADKRKMRDALVRRLRRARDSMTSAWGGGPDDGAADGTDPMAGFDAALGTNGSSGGAATARINEELSRELSIREREAAAQVASIKELEALHAKLSAELAQEQQANTQLLLRNASYLKTRRVLEAKLSELKSQLATVLDRRSAHEKDRLAALRGTVAMQATVINDLNAEIDLHISEQSNLNRRLRATRAVLTNVDGRVSSAMRLLFAFANVADSDPAAAADHSAAPRILVPQPPQAPVVTAHRGGASELMSVATVALSEALIAPVAITAFVGEAVDPTQRHVTEPLGRWGRIRGKRGIISVLTNALTQR